MIAMETETFRVRPRSTRPEISFPLTFFDIYSFKFNPTEFIFLYKLPHPSPENFSSAVLPDLMTSLSLALDYFHPLAGRVVWPPGDPKPLILCDPNGTVSLTVARANNPEAFLLLTGEKSVSATEAQKCVPELSNDDLFAEVISLQVTFFRDYGVAIGISAHHAVLDGKSIVMFMKAWATINKSLSGVHNAPPLPPELTPCLERYIQNDDALYFKLLSWWTTGKHPWARISDNPKSMKLLPRSTADPSLVKRTFKISFNEAEKIKRFVSNKHGADSQTLHLSTFVVAYALAITSIVKAMKVASSILIILTADFRARVGLPENYFGNCVCGTVRKISPGDVTGDDGMATVAKNVGDIVKDLRVLSLEEALKTTFFSDNFAGTVQKFQVTGSPRSGFYHTDFGWGKPVKVDLASLDGSGNIYMIDGEDGDGVQIGLVFEADVMESFSSLFSQGIESCINESV